MSRRPIPIEIGQRFGRLTVIGKDYSRKPSGGWRVRCDCGTERHAYASPLVRGEQRSCGCLARELTSQRSTVHGHGQARDPNYRIWLRMKARCHNPRKRDYQNYGARGITVCDLWRESFKAFIADVGLRPSLAHTIERVNNEGNYEPGNCRWATRLEQARNKRTTRLVTIGGATRCIGEWESLSSLPPGTIHSRIGRGWPIDEELFKPVKRRARKAEIERAEPRT